jgi:hypothetical protein
MFATFSAERRIEDARQMLGCSAIFLSSLAGIPASRLNFALRGLKPLENPDATKLLELVHKLMAIRDAFSPLPLELTRVDEVRGLLNAMDRKGMTPEDIRKIVSTIFEGTNSNAL